MLGRRQICSALALVLVLGLGGGLASAEDGPAPAETLLLQQPTVSAKHVAFVYAQDLWIADRAGGDARRLTSHVGQEATPRFSPDGKWVAFTGHYEGNMDVYAIHIDGGAPRRLTWHPGTDVAKGWHPDGKRVLFGSRRAGGTPVERLYHVPLEGGMPRRLVLPRTAHAQWNADATFLAYTPVRDAFRTWKRYRGGRTTSIWVYDPKTHDVEVVPHVNASDTWPCWVGNTLYFGSDRKGMMDLYSWKQGDKKVESITDFDTFGIQHLSSGAGVLAFARGGALHILDPKVGEIERLRIRCQTDGLYRNPKWKTARGAVRHAAISPNGKRAVFEARGEIITVPREHGPSRNLTDSPGAHDRDPAWSPDGTQVAWFSDASGEYQLHLRDRLGRKPAKTFDLGGAPFYYDPTWSPDGKHLIFSDKGNRLAYITLETGKVTPIATTQGALSAWRPFGVWSPDSKWIAFERKDPNTTYNGVALYELATDTVTRLTDSFGNADSPAFSTKGKYLFFRASVDSGPRSFGLDMSTSAAKRSSSSLYVAVLSKKTPNPMAARSDEETPKKDDEKKKKDADKSKGDKKDADKKGADKKGGEEKPDDAKDEKKKDAPPLIDLEGLDQRILALPAPSGTYWGLACVGKKLLYLDQGQGGPGKLMSFDFDSRKPKSLATGVNGVEVAHGGKHLLVRFGSTWAITNDSGGARKNLGINGVRLRVEPALEWPQILRETWRIQRDFFYDPQMHGVDWDAMWERWSAFLPHVRHRAELSLLQMEMMGELACGHQYVNGGDMPKGPGATPVGLLGADFDRHAGHYRIKRIYSGQNWNPGMRAPLTEPGVDVQVGDHILAVNGRELKAGENLYAAFEATANQPVELTLAVDPDKAEEKPRTTTVVPVSSDGSLRRAAWIEGNRKRVEELSGGRLAYIYMPDTGGRGMRAFDRDYYSQLDREGLVLDERYNGGGKVADYVVSVLGRKVICFWMNREGWLGRTPFGTLDGPKVMVINERAGSGGDAMPWMFKQLGIGTTVGTRTWGGLVGISGYPPLMDGGSVTAANFGIMDRDGNWVVENVGVAPDVEVIEYPKAIIEGGDPQLERAVEIALEQLKDHKKQALPTYKPPTKR